MLGGLAASGWYLCCIVMRMVVDAFAHQAASMGAPGVDEVKWLIPVRPDDQVRLRATVIETRASRTRPDLGFVRFAFELFNGDGARVMTLSTLDDDGAARCSAIPLAGRAKQRARDEVL